MNINKICGFGFEIDEAADMNEIVENISYDSRQELNKISRQKNEKTIFEEKKEAQEKFNSAAHLYEEYDEVAFERKLRIESLFFEHLFESLDNSELKLSEALGSFYKTVREIYEMINIEPESFKQLNQSILTESISDQHDIFTKLITEHLESKFFSLSAEKRTAKYLNESKEYATKLISEGVEPEEALKHAIKTSVMESLIHDIAFTKPIQYRIKHLLEDEDYGKVFDQDQLANLWGTFKNKAHNLSRIVSLAV